MMQLCSKIHFAMCFVTVKRFPKHFNYPLVALDENGIQDDQLLYMAVLFLYPVRLDLSSGTLVSLLTR